MTDGRIQKRQMETQKAAQPKMVCDPVNIPDADTVLTAIDNIKEEKKAAFYEGHWTGRTKGPYFDAIQKAKKKLEAKNKRNKKQRRLVCFSCWEKDGDCCQNIWEVDADHPFMNDGIRTHCWKSYGGDGLCNTITNAVRITRFHSPSKITRGNCEV